MVTADKFFPLLDDSITGIEEIANNRHKMLNYLSKRIEDDNISHFICRLAYCRTRELRKQFVKLESK